MRGAANTIPRWERRANDQANRSFGSGLASKSFQDDINCSHYEDSVVVHAHNPVPSGFVVQSLAPTDLKTAGRRVEAVPEGLGFRLAATTINGAASNLKDVHPWKLDP